MSLSDKYYFISGFLVILISLIAMSMFWSPTYDALRDLGSVSVNESLDFVSPAQTDSWLDWMIVFAYFGFNVLICIALPLIVEHNPIYYIVLFISSFLYAYVVAILSNIMQEIISDLTTNFGHTQFIINHLVELEICFIMLMAIIMFFKRRQESTTAYY